MILWACEVHDLLEFRNYTGAIEKVYAASLASALFYKIKYHG